MLTEAQLRVLDRDGLVTVDTPFTAAEVAAAAAAVDRMFEGKESGFAGDVFAPELVALMQHPFVEAVAKQALRAEAVALRATAVRKTAPRADAAGEPGATPRLEGVHADLRMRLSDLEAVPRRILCAVLVWLTDVNERRAPFMFRPGSHRQMAEAFEKEPGLETEVMALTQFPPGDYAEMVPVLARAGQISVGTTGVIHSGSVNTDTADRKVMFLQYQGKGVPPVKFSPEQTEGYARYIERLRDSFEPSRLHLLEL